jgi:ATP synthase protein I
MPASPTGSDGNSTDGGSGAGRSDKAFEKRAKALGARIEAARQHEAAGQDAVRRTAGGGIDGGAFGRAMQVSSELIGGVAVGALVGWGLDHWLGTSPWLFIAFFLLGTAAGMFNIVRTGLGMKTGPANPNAGPSVPDNDDET